MPVNSGDRAYMIAYCPEVAKVFDELDEAYRRIAYLEAHFPRDSAILLGPAPSSDGMPRPTGKVIDRGMAVAPYKPSFDADAGTKKQW